MKVTLVPYGNLPKVTLSLVVRTGNLNEPAGMPGLADLAGKLMKEGTTSKSSKQIAEDSASMGGAITITVGVDESDIEADVLSEFGPRAATLLADVAEHPLFPESELPRLKNDALRQLSIAKSVPQSMALERFRKILYGEHPYGTVFATQDSIQKSTLADVKKYYSQIDVLVLTSLSEGQPLVILEGNCAGVPVVATDVGACRELLMGVSPEDQALGASGLITPVTSPQKTAAAIIQRRWRRFCDSRRRFSASPVISFAAAACDADCHSRRINSVAAPKMKTKKKSSLRTIGPISAISCLLDGSQRASLSSCNPVSAS